MQQRPLLYNSIHHKLQNRLLPSKLDNSYYLNTVPYSKFHNIVHDISIIKQDLANIEKENRKNPNDHNKLCQITFSETIQFKLLKTDSQINSRNEQYSQQTSELVNPNMAQHIMQNSLQRIYELQALKQQLINQVNQSEEVLKKACNQNRQLKTIIDKLIQQNLSK